MGIKGNRHVAIQRRADRACAFTDDKQAAFLAAFANSCNVSEAARKVGVATSTLYERRMSDPQFKAAWAAAQDNAMAALRAELVARGLALLRAATPEEASHASLAGMDARFLLSLVEAHEKRAGKEPGDIKPEKSDASEASKRLYALLLRMRAERERKAAEVAARKGE